MTRPGWSTLELIETAAQQRILAYDRAGDGHFGTVSAFIKSMRGNDVDATLYWLATMVAAGEDPRFICRRIVIAASEDVGNADPRALQVAVAAAGALELVGLPEAQYALAQAAAYVASAPKSNRVGKAYFAAVADVQSHGSQPVPPHLLNAGHPRMKTHGIGVGYRYPHDYEGADVEQQYLPDLLRDRRYYTPSDQGMERLIGERLGSAGRGAPGGQAAHGPIAIAPRRRWRGSVDVEHVGDDDDEPQHDERGEQAHGHDRDVAQVLAHVDVFLGGTRGEDAVGLHLDVTALVADHGAGPGAGRGARWASRPRRPR